MFDEVNKWAKRIFTAFAIAFVVGFVSGRAYAELSTPDVQDEMELDRLLDAAVLLQPALDTDRDESRKLIRVIRNAADDHEQDPWVALALAFRESSLRPDVGDGRVRGKMGEIGYFQIMPRSTAYRECGKRRDLTDPVVNADTAMCFLSMAQRRCGSSSSWTYTAAYGMKGCPSAQRARAHMSGKRLHSLLIKIGHPGLH